jgi:hypothetical protein
MTSAGIGRGVRDASRHSIGARPFGAWYSRPILRRSNLFYRLVLHRAFISHNVRDCFFAALTERAHTVFIRVILKLAEALESSSDRDRIEVEQLIEM